MNVHRGVHYATMAALVVSNVTTLVLALLIAGPFFGGALGNIAYTGELSKARASAAVATGQSSLETSCPGRPIGVVDGSGRGFAIISDSKVFIELNSSDISGVPYNGNINAVGFATDYETPTLRVLEGSGDITFTGRNRIVVIGTSSIQLTGNYRYRTIPVLGYCGPTTPPAEPEP